MSRPEIGLHKTSKLMRYAPRNNGQFAQIYSEAFRRNVIEEYLTSNVSKMFLLRMYSIKMKSGIQRWMKRYGYEDKKQPIIILPRRVSSELSTRQYIGNSEGLVAILCLPFSITYVCSYKNR